MNTEKSKQNTDDSEKSTQRIIVHFNEKITYAHKNYTNWKKNNEYGKAFTSLSRFLGLIFNMPILMTIATIFIAYFTSKQTTISENIGKITEYATRPYLVIEDIKLAPFEIKNKADSTIGWKALVVGKKGVVLFKIRNKGQTPAYDIVDYLHVDILPADITLPMPLSPIPALQMSTKPYIIGSEIDRFKQSDRIFSEEDSIGINKNESEPGQLWLYFWGRVEYVDIAGIPHRTDFGYRYIFAHHTWFPYKEYNSGN